MGDLEIGSAIEGNRTDVPMVDPPRRSATMTAEDIEAIEREFRAAGRPYVRATVVRREPPVSARVGDRAIVTPDGAVHGWIGGTACAQSVIEEAATAVIGEGAPTLVGIAPDPERIDRPGIETHPMGCHGEGTLEVFLEPVVGRPSLVIVGDSPVATGLARMALELPAEIRLVAPDGAPAAVPDGVQMHETADPTELAEAIDPQSAVVVASMGRCDARGVAAGVLADARYIGLVASRERAEVVIDRAAARINQTPAAIRSAVTTPAGVDIEARTPVEIAVSVLAEVVDVSGPAGVDLEVKREREGGADDRRELSADGQPAAATDPVCGMAVIPEEAAASVRHDGTVYHFCCAGCADRFREAPAEYLVSDGD